MSEQGNNNQNMENSENSENIIQHGGGCPTFGDFKVINYGMFGGCGFDIWDESDTRWWIDIKSSQGSGGTIDKATEQGGGKKVRTPATGVELTNPETLNNPSLFPNGYKVTNNGILCKNYEAAQVELAKQDPLKVAWTAIAGNAGVVGELVDIDRTKYIYAGSDPQKPGNYRFVGLTASSTANPSMEGKQLSDITTALTEADSSYKIEVSTSTFKRDAAVSIAVNNDLFGYTEITGLNSGDPFAIGKYLADKNPGDYFEVDNTGTPKKVSKVSALTANGWLTTPSPFNSSNRYFWRPGKGMNITRASLLSTTDVVSASNIDGGKYKAANIEALVTYTSKQIKGGSEKQKTKRRGKKAKNSTKRNY